MHVSLLLAILVAKVGALKSKNLTHSVASYHTSFQKYVHNKIVKGFCLNFVFFCDNGNNPIG